ALLQGAKARASRHLLRQGPQGDVGARRVGAADVHPGRRRRPRARPAGRGRRLGYARGHRAHEGSDRVSEPLVVITGASSGIGLALAHAFAKEGHALLLIARHMKPVDGLPGDRTVCAEADVADYGALERTIRGAEQRFGGYTASKYAVRAAGESLRE